MAREHDSDDHGDCRPECQRCQRLRKIQSGLASLQPHELFDIILDLQLDIEELVERQK